MAVLGPTNTGKTFLAFERLISYKSGIFGFPLRLLARENYDKAVIKLGIEKVALITGEEKILPNEAKYYFCTAECMPENIEVECIAIDEVQLAADYERGHIFTNRILNLRGIYETIFLGSLTIEKILLDLFPNIKIEKKKRFSKLTYTSNKSLSKLKPRSAIISFNVNSVYEIAETLRTYKGGAAVVLGSLSPRTRNSQVEVYEDRKVDYLVATDAIGMGLNLNINNVTFSSLQKFDGKYTRDLSTSELGQIAGRAGRYYNDGTFGFLKKAGTLDPLKIQSIEDNKFDTINKIYWRNPNINFDSTESVISSLKEFPIKKYFIHKKNAEDEINFRLLSKDTSIKKYLNNSKNINLLWQVCRIPDFQKIFDDNYFELLKEVFLTLINNDGVLEENWLQQKILRLEDYTGGIEELSIKIAKIRTWTYVTNYANWIEDYVFWQNKTHNIENNLSDHLHESLINRFVDFSASFFIGNRNHEKKPLVEVDNEKTIKFNGQKYGYIYGFNLKLELPKSESLFSQNHAKKSIRKMIEDKINNFLKAPSDSLNLGDISKVKIKESVKIYWGNEAIGEIKKGKNIVSPVAETLKSDFIESDKKILITKKLQEWLDKEILITLKPIKDNVDEQINSESRAIIFNTFAQLGTMEIREYINTIKKLEDNDKATISRSGIRIGAKFFFMPNLLKKTPIELNALLWKIYYDSNLDQYYPLPKDGRVSFESKVEMPDTYWLSIGYICLNNFLLRVDVFERVFFLSRQKVKFGPFIESSDLMNPVGCNPDQLAKILEYCGFDSVNLSNNKKLFFYKLKKPQSTKKKIPKMKKKINLKNKSDKFKENYKTSKKKKEPDPNSPFAVLEKLL